MILNRNNPAGKQSWKRILAVMLFGLALLFVPRTVAAAERTEADVKAVLLFHLTQFVSWPAGSLSTNGIFYIGMLGPPLQRSSLEAAIKGETVGGRPIEIRYGRTAAELLDCQIVYISSNARESIAKVVETLGSRPILTVGESDRTLEQGGMIRFKTTAERKIRLQIDLSNVRRSGLNVSAQLLRVSDVVGGSETR